MIATEISRSLLGVVANRSLKPACGITERFAELRRLIDATPAKIWRFDELDGHIRAVEDSIFELDDDGPLSQLFLSSLSPHAIALQQVAYSHWETELERRFVDASDAHTPIDDYPLATRFRRLLTREVGLLAGHRPRRALFVGSGPVPVSGILLHELLDVPVDCIDADRRAAQQSRELLQRLGLADRIRVLHADGVSMISDSYDVILIALLAKPKRDILSQVYRSARPDCQVLCRTSFGLRVLVYEPMTLGVDLEHYRVSAQASADARGDTISSLLLQRLET